MSHKSQYHLSHVGLAKSTIKKKVLTHLYKTATGLEFAAHHRCMKFKQITHIYKNIHIPTYRQKSL
jgi:hypothetical protein